MTGADARAGTEGHPEGFVAEQGLIHSDHQQVLMSESARVFLFATERNHRAFRHMMELHDAPIIFYSDGHDDTQVVKALLHDSRVPSR